MPRTIAKPSPISDGINRRFFEAIEERFNSLFFSCFCEFFTQFFFLSF